MGGRKEKQGMARYFLTEETENLTNWVKNIDKEQVVQVQKCDDGEGGFLYLLTILEWWDNPDVPHKSGYRATHQMSTHDFIYEDNCRKDN